MSLLPSLFALLAAFLAACAGEEKQQAVEVARGVHPIILGAPAPNNYPRWRAVLEPGQLLLKSPTSAGWYAIRLPPPRQIAAPRGLHYESGTMRLTMELGACAIPAYRSRLANRVLLEWDGGRFEGCNGPGTLPDSIAGTWWQLLRIGTEPAPDGRSPAAILHLNPDGALGGTLACNDGGIRTRWTPEGGFIGGPDGFEQTAMGCNQPEAEAFGMRFWAGMMTAQAWRREGTRLFVTFADGSEAELRYLL